MREHSFSLIPFSGANIPAVKTIGRIARLQNLLTVHYSLTGEIADILLPSSSLQPRRKDELWTATCFEFFLANKGQPQYWEFNLSPSGDWNIYHMDSYRRVGFREETLIEQMQVDVRKEASCIAMDAVVDIGPVLKETDPVDVGITSVIQTRNGNETYWALAHPGPHADFHLRESFIIQL